ncbi:helix-turn-helix domain-containing protein [Thermicanus aegyptius]|uniref:helix-turn-helix domain-containing protein n=1 Tax=Thermicanus aegyptius TaxID=94009 RepID=UPI001FDF8E66|nr:helix-turn-helix domain-containing protein [Thermicanus aegyptius]
MVFTVKELAKVLGVSPTTIYNEVAAGRIPHFRVRSRILFNRDVIEKWTLGQLPTSKRMYEERFK